MGTKKSTAGIYYGWGCNLNIRYVDGTEVMVDTEGKVHCSLDKVIKETEKKKSLIVRR